VHHHEGGEEVEHCRNRGRDADVDIRDVDRLRHDEGDGPHHRRHDLPAHARSRFDAAGERRPVAEALHQRNGELAGRDDVRHSRAVDGAHQARRDDRHLGRSAALVAEQAECEVGEQLDHPGLFEERAEQDEQEDVRRRHICRRAVDALGAECQLTDDLVDAVAAVRERARQVLAEQPVQQERSADDRQSDSHHAARRLEHENDRDDPDQHVPVGQVAGTLYEVRFEDPVIEAEDEADTAEDPAEPAAPGGRHQQEGHQQQEADVHRTHDAARDRAERRGDDLEGREGHRDREHGGCEAGRAVLQVGLGVGYRLGHHGLAKKMAQPGCAISN
jgi:hypothetical protein